MRLYLSSFRLGTHPELLVSIAGAGARAAVIANACDEQEPKVRAASVQREVDALTGLGFRPEELDLRAYFDREDAIARDLSRFDVLWARGGNVFVLRRAFRQSGLERALPEALSADRLAYAGYSAGVAVLGTTLRGLDLVDDPHVVPVGYDAKTVYDCLNIVPYAFVPHYRSQHPESAKIEDCVMYLIEHHIPFVALHDGQAIVRERDRERIVG